MNKKAYIIAGAPGSGKSTFAHKLVGDNPYDLMWQERDAIRDKLFNIFDSVENVRNYYSDFKNIREREKEVSKVYEKNINWAIENNKTIVLADTFLGKRSINKLPERISFLKKNGYDVHVVLLCRPLETVLKWNKQRPVVKHVPDNVIRDFYKNIPMFREKISKIEDIKYEEVCEE